MKTAKKAARKNGHKIKNAYDAYWFLHDHPKLNVPERNEVTPEEADKLESHGFLITRDTGGKCYRIWRHLSRHAIDENLEIFYTKTNKPGGHGRVDDDKRKNKHVECWLEIGPLFYGYAYSATDTPMGDWDTETMLHHSHDPYLDTGGSTFDEGLVNLARIVLKRYGDYSDARAEEHSKWRCGKPLCADCGETSAMMKSLKLEGKKKKEMMKVIQEAEAAGKK